MIGRKGTCCVEDGVSNVLSSDFNGFNGMCLSSMLLRLRRNPNVLSGPRASLNPPLLNIKFMGGGFRTDDSSAELNGGE